MNDILKNLKQYDATIDEQRAKERMLDFLKNEEADKFERSNKKRHFTGSGLVIDTKEKKILLNHHKFLNMWITFGGHADGNPDLLDVAQRETIEESGIETVTPISNDIFDLDIHPIPENPKKQEEGHEHYDVLYLFKASVDDTVNISDESQDMAWLSYEEALQKSKSDGRMERILNKVKSKYF